MTPAELEEERKKKEAAAAAAAAEPVETPEAEKPVDAAAPEAAAPEAPVEGKRTQPKAFKTLEEIEEDYDNGTLVPGDTFEGQTWNGKEWVPSEGEKPGMLQQAATSAMDAVALGQRGGDSDFAAASRAMGGVQDDIAMRAQRDAQSAYQLAERDPRVEADKDAATRATSQFQQKMAQISGAAGGGAAVLASVNTQDPSQHLTEHRARADTQRLIGSDQMVGAEQARLAKLHYGQDADEANRLDREDARRQNMQRVLTSDEQTKNIISALHRRF